MGSLLYKGVLHGTLGETKTLSEGPTFIPWDEAVHVYKVRRKDRGRQRGSCVCMFPMEVCLMHHDKPP